MSSPQLSHRVRRIYKELLYLGRSYPLGYAYFRQRCHGAFAARRNLQEPAQIEEGLRAAEFVKREIEALYRLKKYRALKKVYGAAPPLDEGALGEGAADVLEAPRRGAAGR